MKNFVGCGIKNLKVKFGAEKSDGKLKVGIFIGPEIKEFCG